MSLALGEVGMAITFAEFDRAFPGEGWDRAGQLCLTRGVEAMPGDGALSLFNGESGLAVAAWQLSREGRRYGTLRHQLDSRLLVAMRQAAEELAARPAGHPAAAYDVFAGVAGWGASLLLRPPEPPVEETLATVAEAAVKALKMLGHGALNADGSPTRQSADYHDYGMAHGLSGPLAFLALGRREGRLPSPYIKEAIVSAAHWLLAEARHDEWGVNWPPHVRMSGNRWEPVPGHRQAAWCNGPVGIARSLWLAGEATAQARLRRAAADTMLAATRRPATCERLDTPTLCHGEAGRLLAWYLFARDTGEPALASAAVAACDRLLEWHEPTSLLGFVDKESEGNSVDNPSLLWGSAGIALSLLTVGTGEISPWVRILMLD